MTREEALEQEPCEDWYDVPSDEMTLGQARRAVKDLRKKLSEQIEQEPKTGHWIFIGNSDVNGLKICKCDACGKRTYGSHNFCPNCGARMVEPQESGDKE